VKHIRVDEKAAVARALLAVVRDRKDLARVARRAVARSRLGFRAKGGRRSAIAALARVGLEDSRT